MKKREANILELIRKREEEEKKLLEEAENIDNYDYYQDIDFDIYSRRGTMIEGFNIEDYDDWNLCAG